MPCWRFQALYKIRKPFTILLYVTNGWSATDRGYIFSPWRPLLFRGRGDFEHPIILSLILVFYRAKFDGSLQCYFLLNRRQKISWNFIFGRCVGLLMVSPVAMKSPRVIFCDSRYVPQISVAVSPPSWVDQVELVDFFDRAVDFVASVQCERNGRLSRKFMNIN